MGDSPGLVVFRSNTSCRLWVFTWIIWISVLQLFTCCDTFPFLEKLKRHISFSIAPSRQSICPLFCCIFVFHFFLVLPSVVCHIVTLSRFELNSCGRDCAVVVAYRKPCILPWVWESFRDMQELQPILGLKPESLCWGLFLISYTAPIYCFLQRSQVLLPSVFY